MKKTVQFILIVAAAVAVFTGIYFLYSNLKDDYAPNQMGTQDSSETGGEKSEKPAAPNFTVLDENGKEVKLSDYKGKPVVLNFWASWCYYCKKEMPDFNEAYHENPDVQFMMINVTDSRQETMDSAKKFLEGKNYDFPVFYDTNLEAARAYGAAGLPMSIFIDRDGNVVTYANGMLDKKTLEKGIEMRK